MRNPGWMLRYWDIEISKERWVSRIVYDCHYNYRYRYCRFPLLIITIILIDMPNPHSSSSPITRTPPLPQPTKRKPSPSPSTSPYLIGRQRFPLTHPFQVQRNLCSHLTSHYSLKVTQDGDLYNRARKGTRTEGRRKGGLCVRHSMN